MREINDDRRITGRPGQTGDVWQDVRGMQSKFGIDTITKSELWGRLLFIQEELDEAKAAFLAGDAEGVLDGLQDINVVSVGTVVLTTTKPIGSWLEVMRANMDKEAGVIDKRHGGVGIDLAKPEGWRAPDLAFACRDLRDLLADEWAPDVPAPEQDRAMGPDDPVAGDWRSSSGTPPLDLFKGSAYADEVPSEIPEDREVLRVFEQCADMIRKKGGDYNGAATSVKTSDYWPRGISDLVYMFDVLKRFRMVSVLEQAERGAEPNFDALEDILIDRINFMALAVEWIRGRCPGQDPAKDIFNR